MKFEIGLSALQQLFFDARSYNGWLDGPVTDDQIRRIYDIVKMGPTSFNCCPGRFVFLRTPEAKQRIEPHLRPNNVHKTMTAAVVAIIAYDSLFHDQMPKLTPHRPETRDFFAGNEELANVTAFRNGTLQGAYFLIAARAVGLDCGPISGFDNAGVDAEFFPDGQYKSNFICGLGRGDPESLFGRLPRLYFDEVCSVL